VPYDAAITAENVTGLAPGENWEFEVAVSLAAIVILSLLVDYAFRRLRMPGLVGMLIVGALLGPCVLGLLDPRLLEISADLRLIALIVILLRAGLELSRETLSRVGGRALLLSTIPAILEMVAVTLIAPRFLLLTYLEAAMLGAILAAVSPAVVVPLMIGFIERGLGARKGIPTLLLAAASVDDVFVIVIYGVLADLYLGRHVNLAWQLAGIPISILVAVAVGMAAGVGLCRLFERFNPRATKRVLILLGLSILLMEAEHFAAQYIPFAALLAVMATGFYLLEHREDFAHEVSAKLGKVWVLAEIVLFAMVGAQVDLQVALHAGLAGAAVVALGLIARSIGTYACLLGSDLTKAERVFVVVSYLPKATVQAAIGAAPLAAMQAVGLPTAPGAVILAVAVLSIILTAPLGAWAIALLGERVFSRDEEWADTARAAALASRETPR